jgi:predicted DNA-binding protein (UPF0251 family)
VRAATRPAALARTPFTRAEVDDAVAVAFGSTGEDLQLRRVVELADLDPEVSHDQAMARLAVSRATYYRYLRQARARVAAALVDRAASRLQT